MTQRKAPKGPSGELGKLAQAVLAGGDLDSKAALALASALQNDLRRLLELDERSSPSGALISRLVDLPLRLSLAGKSEQALAVAAAFQFVSPDDLNGDIAVILARAGRRSEALARIAANLAAAKAAHVAEAKAGDAYRALGEDDAAEAYYRRSLAEAKDSGDRHAAVLRITTLLLDTGREADARAFLAEQRRARMAPQ